MKASSERKMPRSLTALGALLCLTSGIALLLSSSEWGTRILGVLNTLIGLSFVRDFLRSKRA